MSRAVAGLLGPNGAGKTTMLRLFSTVLAPDAGTITVAGHDVTGSHAERTEARRRIGYLPQEVVFPRGMTKRSDRAAAAAGSVAVPERTRTVALATAVVVPLAAALLWFVAVLIAYRVNEGRPWERIASH